MNQRIIINCAYDNQALSNWNVYYFFGLITYLTKSLESLDFNHVHACKIKFYRSTVTTNSSSKKKCLKFVMTN